jgi:VanZ family protein
MPATRSATAWTVALVGWLLVILAETWRSIPPIAPIGSDTLSHFSGFLVLGVLAIMTLRCWHVSDGPWIAALGCLFFGTISEGGQLWVPGREVALSDWAANVSGAFLGIAAVAVALFLANRSSGTDV